MKSIFNGIAFIIGGFIFGGFAFVGARESENDLPVVVVIACVGFLLAGVGVFGIWRGLRGRTRAARYANEPWRLNAQWASGRIKDCCPVNAVGIIVFAVFWNLIAWPVALSAQANVSLDAQKPYILAFVALFPLIGIGLVVVAVYRLLRWLKNGSSVFEMAQVPGVIGGTLEGVILTKVFIRGTEGVRLKLRNVHRWTNRSGKDRATTTETLWESDQRVEQSSGDSRAANTIPVHFDIPPDRRPTQSLGLGEEYYWELIATGDLQGIDYKAVFVVPVFEVSEDFGKTVG